MGKTVMMLCRPVNFGPELAEGAAQSTDPSVRFDEEVASVCVAKVRATPAYTETKSGKPFA
jgi:hypothetical protein